MCHNYEKRNGEHGLRYRSDDVSESWTPVRRRRRGRCGVENGGRGLVIGEGALFVWKPLLLQVLILLVCFSLFPELLNAKVFMVGFF